jgi:type VI secretion system protein ImpL
VLKYIIAIVVIVLAWAICFVLQLPWILAIAATGLVLFVLLSIYLYRKYKALKAAREIEKALNAQAEEQARAARPEQQTEIRAMQAEVNRAITALKNSKLGSKGGAAALYALPWYVIIGPPGSGKTTALRNSGIPFPYMSPQSGGGVRGVGGTRNCEWWLSNEGVLLDTAGRYMTDDDDRDEWLSFLDLLRQNRPLKPLNGIIVAVNVAELGSAREQQVEAIARRIRERVDEVQARLQVTLPVYVLFTKCDLVAGFIETFDDLRKSERGQIWGFTVPLARPTDVSPSALFAERFEEMTRTIAARALKRVSQEPNLARREAIYQFPQQFASLKQNLGDFLDALFAGNIYQAAPLLRGVYFTSGTQEGRPIDQLAEKLRASFGLPAAPAPVVAPPQEQKSYFLRDVFAKVIFPDQHIAALSAEERKRLERRKYYFALGAFGLAGLVSIIPANAYWENRKLTERCDDAAALIARRVQQGGGSPMTLAELQPLRNVVSELKSYEDGHPPIAMTFGMYQGSALYPKMSQLFATAMQRQIVQPLFNLDVRDMQAFVQRMGDNVPSSAERSEYYNRLKLHLLLSTPKQSNEPPLEGNVATFATDQLAGEWAARVGQGAPLDDTTRAAMRQNAALFTALLARDPRLLIARQQPVVSSVRQVLNRTSSIDIALNDIVASVDSSYDIDLARAINRAPLHLRQVGAPETFKVRGAFTRVGWENFVRERLNRTPEQIAGDAWVLGQAPNVDRQRQLLETLVQVRSQYFSAYIAEWRAFLGSIRAREPSDAAGALAMLDWLTQGSTPAYVHLMRTVGENITLPDPDNQTASAAGQSLLRSIEREINNRLNRTRTGQAINQATRAGLAARTGDSAPSTFVHREDVERDPLLRGLVEFGVPPPPPQPQPNQPPPPPPPDTTSLREYQEQLAFVRDALRTYLDNPRSASQPLLQKVSEAQTKVAALINLARVDSRPVLENLLPPPIRFTAQRTLGALGGEGNDRWCAAVWTPFQRTLYDHYPYNPNGSDAAIADVAQFYAEPNGSLWSFYTEELASRIPRAGGSFQFTEVLAENTGSVYRPELLEFLARSQEITTVLFPPPAQRTPPGPGQQGGGGGSGPSVDFEVRIRPTPTIAETTFTVDGEEFRYTNGPEEWHRFHWPGSGNQRGAKIRARGLNGIDETIEQDGEWGVFRLFELGQVRGSANSRIFSVTWHLRNQNLAIGVDVRPVRSENPFFGLPRRDASADRYLSPFRATNVNAPSPIARGARACSTAGLPRSSSPRRRRHAD